ncbi:MAG: hypothetical protein A2722_01455 [Candidatus Doudnabacteria bacterium RIFCSPHIGHO2_01_FULL_50_11]|uniref:Uncharacterized protein n=1 Tax=Candidatus Doudnabacteria bacterium RIFCSPHIGHO2_01_FULL_50_11 TaxID=1817828 RepID=A0A1F5PH34_9BACT|nr:MAG: hypothetical protein A2722_01455 [Candidatus Doudnabacteria bacterium RIFCSPHIGHO2_01_FULL_50_11]HLC44534.1 hypothetical protein [Patescibacteria group bacterium]
MNRSTIAAYSFFQALAAAIYVAAVGTLLFHSNEIFGQLQTPLGPIAFLMLFSLSAAIMALLLAGRPIYLYLEGRKRESIQTALMNVGFFFLITFIFLLLVAYML